MRIHHVAIWTFRLEEMKEFYIHYFKGVSNQKYINPKKQFESYFIRFESGTDLELMSRTDIQDAPIEENRLGLTHLAFAFDSKEAVLQQTELLRTAGYTITGEPRTSGDGYFESVVLDPDGNRIECVFQASQPDIHICLVIQNKKHFLDLLLLADEQESMIDRYLERGDMYTLYDHNRLIAACVVTNEGDGIYEIKNLVTHPSYQRQGYGQYMIEFLAKHYQPHCHTLLVGTGDSQLTIPFYERCGFTFSHRVSCFFTDNYDLPIIENGEQLIDMIYMKRSL